MRTNLHSRDLRFAATRESDNCRAPVSRMRLPRDEPARFECVNQVGDITRRAAQKLAELSLRPLRLTLQLPEEFSPGWRQAPFRQARSGGSHSPISCGGLMW